ncbi:MAG: dicarboxylate/amino acid:cation symporter [Erysipelotrichales bacterium]|nr:dicarboxylate/amino acid:cation symporter [Erysipelotrichales bacterium]
MKKSNHSLAIKMVIALICGLLAGLGCIFLRENLLSQGNKELWLTINNLLFQDITAEGAESALGLFYIVGQLFVNTLQLIIIPMVFTSIALAICAVTDTKKLGRISTKTVKTFLLTTTVALIFAGTVGGLVYQTGAFNVVDAAGVTVQQGATGSNPLNIIVSIIPSNIFSAMSSNGNVLAVVFLGVTVGLAMNQLKERTKTVKKLLLEINDIISTCLTFVISNFAPYAIFCLLTRTFAIYGVDYLKPALAYVITAILALLVYLFVGYPIYIKLLTKLNPIPYIKKVAKVALFGFSTSSSAATLPLNKKTTVEELGVQEEIASFVLPLGMTINMDGTAIMQVIAAIFVAASAGYEVSITSVGIIAILALVASIGTPAAPGAGAVILFTVLTGMGYNNDMALLAYSLILSINRPIEMLVTSLNVVGDSTTSLVVAKSENMVDEDIYYN